MPPPPPSPIAIRKAAASLASCPGWTDLVRPHLERRFEHLRGILLGSTKDEKALIEAHAEHTQITNLFATLHASVSSAFADPKDKDDSTPSARAAILAQFQFPVGGLHPSPLPAVPPKIEFPTTGPFNPFQPATTQ